MRARATTLLAIPNKNVTREVRVAVLCALVVLLDGLDTQVIGYLGPALAAEWKIPPAVLGPVFSAGLVGLMGGLLTLGPLADVWGRKRTILVSVALFGVFTLLTAQARGVTDLMIYRIIAGIGLGGAMPNALALTGEYSAPQRRATVTVAMFCGFSLGSVLGGGMTATLIQEHGWRSIFLIGGVLPVVMFLVVMTAGLLFTAYSLYADIDETGVKVTTILPYLLLFVSLMIALGFEFVNGFHDTANAVATVIYTHSLPPPVAVVWSGVRTLVRSRRRRYQVSPEWLSTTTPRRRE